MLVLGIDPGTAITGYGLVRQTEDGRLERVDYGVIRAAANTPLPQRLVELYTEIKQVISLHQPDTSAVEKLFFTRNVKTGISVGQARGVVLLALAQANLSIAEYSPNEIKLAVSGYGNADKRQVQEMVRVLLSLDDLPKPDDAADALAVSICHLHSARMDLLPEDEG